MVSPPLPRRRGCALLLALACALSPGLAFAEEPAQPPDPEQPAAPAPPAPRRPASSTFDVDTEGRHAAVPLSIPQSPAMIHTGMVFTGLGLFGVVTGLLVVQQASSYDSAESDNVRLAGALIIGGGAVLAAIGIPLWTLGARPVATRATTSTRPTLWLGPRSAALSASF